MSKSTVMGLLADRPVAYHPDIARIVGGVKAAVFLCQLLYWTGKGKRRDGFIWKTQAEMEKETGLTRCEQEGARKKLGTLGVLDEKLAGIPATLHYRVNTEQLAELMDAFYNKQDCGKPANSDVENLQTNPESTLENTTHGAGAPLALAGEKQEQELVGEPALDAALGERQTPKVAPITSTGDWTKGASDPWRTWGAESEELQRQKRRFGPNADAVLKLGHELNKALGLHPIWSNPKKVKSWTAGLNACLQAAGEYGHDLVMETARKMREDKLTIKDPWSIEGMVAAAAAEKRSGGAGNGSFGSLSV